MLCRWPAWEQVPVFAQVSVPMHHAVVKKNVIWICEHGWGALPFWLGRWSACLLAGGDHGNRVNGVWTMVMTH